MKRAGWALVVAAVLASPAAHAWCQSSTCNPEKGDDCHFDANGCKTVGSPRVWRAMPITFRFSSRHPATLLREDARAAIRAAFYRWSDTLCGPEQRQTSLRFVEGEEITEDKPLLAGGQAKEPYGIFFRDTGWPYEGKADSTLAQTNTNAGLTTGLISYADMEINTGSKRFTTTDDGTGNDLQAVITHEVGHYIGLDHSKVSDSIMVTAYCQDEEARCAKGIVAARRLANDDIDAVCTLYPPTGYPEKQAPSDTHGCDAGGNGDTSLVSIGLAALAAAIARRYSTKRAPRNDR